MIRRMNSVIFIGQGRHFHNSPLSLQRIVNTIGSVFHEHKKFSGAVTAKGGYKGLVSV